MAGIIMVVIEKSSHRDSVDKFNVFRLFTSQNQDFCYMHSF